MKYQSKSNQSKIYSGPKIIIKEINVIKIDVVLQSVTLIKISNSISFIQKNLDIYNYDVIPVERNSYNCFIVGLDEDLKQKKSFTIKGVNGIFYGDSIVVEIPKSNDYEKLKSTQLKIEDIKSLIAFND